MPRKRPIPRRALSELEAQRVLAVLHEDRFVDKAPAEIYAMLLDEGVYLCSISTMYRILRKHNEVRERRNVLRHPQYTKPELLATAPKQVWSWDITKLKGPVKWTYYYAYVIVDIYSRYVVGWMVASRENGKLAKRLVEETCERQRVSRNKLILHSDRGSPMKSQTLAQLLGQLGVTKSFSRPHVSNDNPFSEAHFKTLKYFPEFPERFGSIEDARAFLERFFEWYNNEHRHFGIALMTPAMVHYKKAEACNRMRGHILRDAYEQHPERFVKGCPKPLELPKEAWINRPQQINAKDGENATESSGVFIGGD